MSLKNRIANILKFDAPEYKQMVSMYNVKDGIQSLILSVAFILFFMLVFIYQFQVQMIHFICMLVIPFVILLYKGDRIETLGFTKRNMGRSLLHGLCWGIALFLIIPRTQLWPPNLPQQTISVAVHSVREIYEQVSILDYNFFGFVLSVFLFYPMLIAVSEEVFFRGYIQTRIYGIIRSDFFAILYGGFLFALLHVPEVLNFVSTYYDVSLISAVPILFRHYTSLTFPRFLFHTAFHFLFVYLHRKHNNIIGPIVVHFLVNLRSPFMTP